MENEPPRMILALASEADDEEVWDQVKTIQAEMFSAGGISVKLAYFGREGAHQVRPCISTRWVTDADDMADIMDHARRNCVCGCFVEIGNILERALRETQQGPIQAVVIVGDSFCGDLDAAVVTAKQLRDAGTRLFVFQIGNAGGALRDFAEATDSVYVKINPHVEKVAKQLPTMLEAITHFTVGGKTALEALDNEAADRLLEQIDAADQIAGPQTN
jgi:hypothetical protein